MPLARARPVVERLDRLQLSVPPKQPGREFQRDWYPYYAGYTEEFVTNVIDAIDVGCEGVLDPWNGSGTTTAVAHQLGLRSAGVDINPALTVIARARLLTKDTSTEVVDCGRQIIERARHWSSDIAQEDFLSTWFSPNTVARLRCLIGATNHVLGLPEELQLIPPRPKAAALDALSSFFYTAIFAVTRDALRGFRSTNPTWLRIPNANDEKVELDWQTIESHFLQRVSHLQDKLKQRRPSTPTPGISIETACSTSLPFPPATFAAVISSPPYATRIDYIRGTAAELAILGASAHDVGVLRSQSTGSPVVRHVNKTLTHKPSYVSELLAGIERHPSKGSARYYFPWLRNYFSFLFDGLDEALRVLTPAGHLCLVLQDSYYKDIHIDLQRATVEHLAARECPLLYRIDYPVHRLRARMNPRARRHLPNRDNFESLLIFGRERI